LKTSQAQAVALGLAPRAFEIERPQQLELERVCAGSMAAIPHCGIEPAAQQRHGLLGEIRCSALGAGFFIGADQGGGVFM